MVWITSLGQGVILALSVVAALGIGFLVWKRALLGVQEHAMDVQSDVIEAYALRIKQLEENGVQDARERAQLRGEIDELRGEIRGQRDLALAIVETIAESRVCLAAPGCENRIVPTI